MSVARRIMHWLALKLRPGESAPDAQDLNLPRPFVQPPPVPLDQLPLTVEQQRRYRHACWRAGPWQQK